MPKMKLLYWSLGFFLSLANADPAEEPQETELPAPCTIKSPASGAFFDLRGLHIQDPALSTSDNPRDYSWNTTGYDMGYNFTLNFCGGVVENLEAKGVVGLEKDLWKNVSAYYEHEDKIYSIG